MDRAGFFVKTQRSSVMDWICTEQDYDREYVIAQLDRHSVKRLSGCIEWSGSKGKGGYGVLYATRRPKRRRVGAHRAAWLVRRGDIPAGLVPDHLCRNTSCVNVKHMEVVTNAINTRRGDHTRKRGRSGVRPGRAIHTCRKHDRDDGYLHKNKAGYQSWTCRICRREAVKRYRARKRQS